MNEPPRGTYTPQNDPPLSFDARAPVRGSRPVPMTLIVSAVILATLIVAIFLIYRGGVRGAVDAPQPVGQVVGAMKGAAPPENRSSDPAAGLQIYRGDAGASAPTTFAPPPETPAVRPTPSVAGADPIGVALENAEAASAKPAPVVAAAKPLMAAPVPARAKAAAVTVSAPVKAVTLPVAAKPVVVATAAVGSGVQIGAFSSAALAEQGWSDAVKLAPGLATGKGKSITPVESGGKTLYRTTVTGFASKGQADAFCGALKAAGKSCFIR